MGEGYTLTDRILKNRSYTPNMLVACRALLNIVGKRHRFYVVKEEQPDANLVVN